MLILLAKSGNVVILSGMPDQQKPKPRCKKCKSIIIRGGTFVEGMARIKCDNCGEVNNVVVTAVKSNTKALPVL
jgi:phage FluMu protein Com